MPHLVLRPAAAQPTRSGQNEHHPTTALKAIAFALDLLGSPAMALDNAFLDDDLSPGVQSGSETEAYVYRLCTQSEAHTMPSNRVVENC